MSSSPRALIRAVALLQRGDAHLAAALRCLSIDAPDEAPAAELRGRLAAALGEPDTRLCAYGSLRPGESNHDVVAALAGSWSSGCVRGRLRDVRWDVTHVYPALEWDPAGEVVPVAVLASPDLPRHWPRIDAFEGPHYRRVWLPVERGDGSVLVASGYVRARA